MNCKSLNKFLPPSLPSPFEQHSRGALVHSAPQTIKNNCLDCGVPEGSIVVLNNDVQC